MYTLVEKLAYIKSTAFNIERRLVLHHLGIRINGHQFVLQQPPRYLETGACLQSYTPLSNGNISWKNTFKLLDYVPKLNV